MTQEQDARLRKSFIRHFLWIAYANMEMEDEVCESFDVDVLYARYKPTIDALIEEGFYKTIRFADEG